jgi:hypothetical protein
LVVAAYEGGFRMVAFPRLLLKSLFRDSQIAEVAVQSFSGKDL